MDTELLDRHLPPRTSVAARDGDEEPADLGAFGWLRGVKDRAVMLELRKKDGSIVAFPYTWLERAEFDPSVGIMLKFGITTVKITGRNMNTPTRGSVRMFDGIVRHRVPWIQEADRPAAMAAAMQTVVIEAISVG